MDRDALSDVNAGPAPVESDHDERAPGCSLGAQQNESDTMENVIQLTPSWMLTTEHPSSHDGIPVLVNRTTGEAYGPHDVVRAYASPGLAPAAHFVVRIVKTKHFTDDEKVAVGNYLRQWPEGPQLDTELIHKHDFQFIRAAIEELVNEYGHPDDIPLGALAQKGVEPSVAEKCEALLSSEDFPEDHGEAVAKWLRVIGEFSE